MTELPPTSEHPELAVAVAPVGVRVSDGQGRCFDAEIFLHEEGERRAGRETLEDRLNDPDGRFLPCRIDGEMQILHLDRLAWMELDGVAPEVARRQEMEARRTAVELVLTTGEHLEGDLVYLLPEARSRPSDVLNRSDAPFLVLLASDATRYVHRSAVLRVRLR